MKTVHENKIMYNVKNKRKIKQNSQIPYYFSEHKFKSSYSLVIN